MDDLDVAVDSASRSEEIAAAILEVSGISLIDNAYLGEPDKQMILKNVRLYSDIVTSITGVEFAEAYQSAHVVEVEGVAVRVLSKDHLIRNKRASGREKDLQDVERLEAIATI